MSRHTDARCPSRHRLRVPLGQGRDPREPPRPAARRGERLPRHRRLRRDRAAPARERAARRARPGAARRARPGQDPADAHHRRAARRVEPGGRGLRDQRRPDRAGVRALPAAGRRARRRAAGRWRHRDERYVEKLATPDTSVGDLVGDVDPVKVAEGRTLGDPETVHYGLLPRTNRGVFGINELPDLAERIQVAMFNVLEERDIQVRGYSPAAARSTCCWWPAPTPRTTPTAAGSSPRSRTGSAPRSAPTTRSRWPRRWR